MAETLFYILSAVAVACGVRVITARSPLTSVLSLLGAFVCLAVIYLLAGFQFLAAAQVLVYAGAIMVLFLFVVMLLNMDDEDEHPETPGAALGPRRLAIAGAVAAVLVGAGTLSIGLADATAPSAAALAAAPIDDLEGIAALLFSRYMLPFEAASLLLLATMVGVILLAKRQRGGLGQTTSPASYPYRVPEFSPKRPAAPHEPAAPLPTEPTGSTEDAGREEVRA